MAERRYEAAARDAVLTRIGKAIMLHRGGDREEARNRLRELWEELGAEDDPFQRCTLAHFLADTQDDPLDELEWDLRALEAADEFGRLGRRRAEWHASASAVRGFYPSLHLSLAADYVKLARHEEARDHLARARELSGALADDDHGRRVRSEMARLELRLAG